MQGAHAGGEVKVCALCGETKALDAFGPKRGAKNDKDCYCRICSTLRRRHTLSVRPTAGV